MNGFQHGRLGQRQLRTGEVGLWIPSEARPDSGLGADLIVAARGVWKVYRRGDRTGGLRWRAGARRGEEVAVEALRGVDFDVRRGEIVAIMGPSGCGKTTLLNCLSGIDNVDGGEIWIDGRPLQTMSDKELTRYRATSMGFVFQSFNLLPVLTAVENVEYPLLVTNVPPRAARRRAMATLEAVGLGDRAGQLPAQLSGGQQQRVAVARAIVGAPAIVWADEPTGNLDSGSAASLMALLCGLNQTLQQTLVIVTHAREVGEYADRVVHLRDGRVEQEGSA